MISTTTEVTTFYRALLEGELLRPESLEAMMTTVTQTNGETYGLGLARKELPCGPAWGHQGNFPGYMMESWSTPGAGRQVTVAYNLDPNSMQPPSADAVKQLMTDAFCGVKP
jgi:D-alanyl-D-alanine carboxypeptidase